MIKPPINFTGSKFNLLSQLLPNFDYSKNNFVDLFSGSGVVYLNLLEKYENIIINDIIKDLIDIQYNLIFNPIEFTEKTKKLVVNKNDKEGYLNLRFSYNKEPNPEKLLALINCCNNNMMRFNKNFQFNQTFGRRTWNKKTDKKLNDFINQINFYKNLNDKLSFFSLNFYEIKIPKDSMVYIDPPYMESEAGYNCYWSKQLDDKLYNYIKELNNKNISFALSGLLGPHKNNKRSKLIDNLIKDNFNYKILKYNYEKVSKIKDYKKSEEILIFNY